MLSADIQQSAAHVVSLARERRRRLTTAESCTGGLLAASITSVPGSSEAFGRGWVTYSNESKIELLGVPYELLSKHGAVSAEVAFAMAEGALANGHSDLAVAITGIAGPNGGSEAKPVGYVVFAAGIVGGPIKAHRKTFGDLGRDGVRAASVSFALELMEDMLLRYG